MHPAFTEGAHFITPKLSPQSAQLDRFAGFSVFGNSGDFEVWAIGAGNRVNRILRVREVIRAVPVCKGPFAFLSLIGLPRTPKHHCELVRTRVWLRGPTRYVILIGGMMRKFLFGFIAATMLLAGDVCRADVVKYDSVDGPVNYLGNYLLGAGGSLTQLNQSASAGPNWFQKTSGVGSFFNIGTTAAAPFTNSEYVSLGNGASASAGICQFFLEYAANTADGTLQAQVNIYTFDGTGANQAPIASFLLNLPTPGGTAGTFLYGITVTLPQAQHFTMSAAGFEYGFRMTGGVGNFGPRLQTNFPGQTFGQLDTHLGGVGTSLNAFQSFTPPGQNGGAFSGNFWFGATGPWAGAVFSMAIPEPATGAAFLLIGIAGVFARRRR